MRDRAMTLALELCALWGIPASNANKIAQAFTRYYHDIKEYGIVQGLRAFDADSENPSANGQYERLYDALVSKDAEVTEAARAKIRKTLTDQAAAKGVILTDKDIEKATNTGLKSALKKYDDRITEAAQARMDGYEAQRVKIAKEIIADGFDQDIVELGSVSEAQAEIRKILKAGWDDSAIKQALTGEYKSSYVSGSVGDRVRIARTLLQLKNSKGVAYYTQKDLDKWATDSQKK